MRPRRRWRVSRNRCSTHSPARCSASARRLNPVSSRYAGTSTNTNRSNRSARRTCVCRSAHPLRTLFASRKNSSIPMRLPYNPVNRSAVPLLRSVIRNHGLSRCAGNPLGYRITTFTVTGSVARNWVPRSTRRTPTFTGYSLSVPVKHGCTPPPRRTEPPPHAATCANGGSSARKLIDNTSALSYSQNAAPHPKSGALGRDRTARIPTARTTPGADSLTLHYSHQGRVSRTSEHRQSPQATENC